MRNITFKYSDALLEGIREVYGSQTRVMWDEQIIGVMLSSMFQHMADELKMRGEVEASITMSSQSDQFLVYNDIHDEDKFRQQRSIDDGSLGGEEGGAAVVVS